MRDDRSFAGPAPPAALFQFSRDGAADNPRRNLATYAEILLTDTYGGFEKLYRPNRKPAPITEAACRVHFRRKLFDLSAVARAPLAAEAVRCVDRGTRRRADSEGCLAAGRLLHRCTVVAPLVADLHA